MIQFTLAARTRAQKVGTSDGNLWKCSYDSHGPADLRNPDANMAEDNNKDDFTYELKETGSDFATAKAQLQDFIKKIIGKAHGTPGDSFYKWTCSISASSALLVEA